MLTSPNLMPLSSFFFNFLALLCLHYSTGFSLAVANRGSSLAVVHALLTAAAFLVVGLRLCGVGASVVAGTWALEHRLSSCGWSLFLDKLPLLNRV